MNANIIPEKELTITYRSILSAEKINSGSEVAVLSGGGEYTCIPLRKKYSSDIPGITEFLSAAAPFAHTSNAVAIAKSYRVPVDQFDAFSDTECEIRSGIIPKLKTLHGFRSFVWNLYDTCINESKIPADCSAEELLCLSRMAFSGSALHYSGKPYCPAICAVPDQYVSYIPEVSLEKGNQILGPSPETLKYEEHMKAKYPNWEECIPSVVSLDELRKELDELYPVIRTLVDARLDDPSVKSVITGWCTLAAAAEEPFFTQNDPSSGEFYPYSD